MDSDIDSILSHTIPGCDSNAAHFLQAPRQKRPGGFYGDLFDTWAKARAIEACSNTTLDNTLPNGKNHDILYEVDGSPIHFEATVITQDDGSRKIWEEFLERKAIEPEAVLRRPDPHSKPNIKARSLYYECLRVYAKVFDKLAKGLDDKETQCHPTEPNVLLLSFSGPGVSPGSPGVRWALDELLADQSRFSGRLTKAGITDVSLDAWLEFTALNLFGQLDADEWNERYNRAISAPRKLSGIVLFDGSTLTEARINYNAAEGQRITSKQMAEIEATFSESSPYL